MKLSVALCTYNGAPYIREQLDSILQQRVAVDEIVVCDDGSTDDTLEMLNEYVRKNPRLFNIIKNSSTLGYAKNFEKALRLATGEIIFLSDQDDIWKPDKTEVMKSVFAKDHSVMAAAHNIQILENGREKTGSFWNREGFKKNYSNVEILKYVVLKGNVFPGMTLAIRSDFKKKLLPFKHFSPLIIHDYEIVIQSCKENSFRMVDVPLSCYRLHDGQNIGFGLGKTNVISLPSLFIKRKTLSETKKLVLDFGLPTQFIDENLKDYGILKENYLAQFSGLNKVMEYLKLKYYKL